MTLVTHCLLGTFNLIPISSFRRKNEICVRRCNDYEGFSRTEASCQRILLPQPSLNLICTCCKIRGAKYRSRTRIVAAVGAADVTIDESNSAESAEAADQNSQSPEGLAEQSVATKVQNPSAGPATAAKRKRPGRKSVMPPVKDVELVPGASFAGIVRSVMPFGIFVDFGAYTDGLVHVSRISNEFVRDVAALFTVGQEVQVRLVEVNKETGRISLTMRTDDDSAKMAPKREPSARDSNKGGRRGNTGAPSRVTGKRGETQKRSEFVEGAILSGTVKNLIRSGAFIKLSNGEEGFLPTSEESDRFESKLGKSELQVGEEVNVRVLRIAEGKITLTMKEEQKKNNYQLWHGDVYADTSPFMVAFRKNKGIAAFLDQWEMAKKSVEQPVSDAPDAELKESVSVIENGVVEALPDIKISGVKDDDAVDVVVEATATEAQDVGVQQGKEALLGDVQSLVVDSPIDNDLGDKEVLVQVDGSKTIAEKPEDVKADQTKAEFEVGFDQQEEKDSILTESAALQVEGAVATFDHREGEKAVEAAADERVAEVDVGFDQQASKDTVLIDSASLQVEGSVATVDDNEGKKAIDAAADETKAEVDVGLDQEVSKGNVFIESASLQVEGSIAIVDDHQGKKAVDAAAEVDVGFDQQARKDAVLTESSSLQVEGSVATVDDSEGKKAIDAAADEIKAEVDVGLDQVVSKDNVFIESASLQVEGSVATVDDHEGEKAVDAAAEETTAEVDVYFDQQASKDTVLIESASLQVEGSVATVDDGEGEKAVDAAADETKAEVDVGLDQQVSQDSVFIKPASLQVEGSVATAEDSEGKKAVDAATNETKVEADVGLDQQVSKDSAFMKSASLVVNETGTESEPEPISILDSVAISEEFGEQKDANVDLAQTTAEGVGVIDQKEEDSVVIEPGLRQADGSIATNEEDEETVRVGILSEAEPIQVDGLNAPAEDVDDNSEQLTAVAESQAVQDVGVTETVVDAQPTGATISPAVVKQLREETGAGMMDCKKALAESEGDIAKARELLRKKGLASADKKSGRATAEGRIGSYVHDNRIGVLVEVNCETDFVSRGEIFRELVDDLAMQVAACPQVRYMQIEDVPEDIVSKEKEIEMQKEDLQSKPAPIREKIVEGRMKKRLEEFVLLEQPFIKNDKVTVKDWVKQTISTIGENMRVRRFTRYTLGEGLEKKSQDFAAEVAAQTSAKAAISAPKDAAVPAETAEPVKATPAVAVPVALVKQLREETGAGMMDCKKALSETGGDLEKAQQYLRKKGLSSADKKSARLASEGVISSYIHDARIGCLIEVNSETDFVARNEKFRELVGDLAMQVVACPQVEYVSVEDIPEDIVRNEKAIEMQRDDLKSKPEHIREMIVDGRIAKRLGELALLEQPFIKDDSKTVKDLVKETVAVLGENIKVRRFVRYTLGEQTA